MKAISLVLLSSGLALAACKPRFFRMPAGSMENTIMTGQSFYVQPAEKFERDEIVVFDYYGNDYSSPEEAPGRFKHHWEKRVFRLIACSGDIIELKDGEIFINNKHAPFPRLAKMPYEIRSGVPIDELDQDPSTAYAQSYSDTIIYIALLTRDQAEDYRKRRPAIGSVRRKPAGQYLSDTSFARLTGENNWNQDNYGPLKIPSPGETLVVTDENYKLYKNIPGIQMGPNTVKEKLYFVLGDNRHFAEDSRFIGLISHTNMYGIVK
jgi:signal peptidase I